MSEENVEIVRQGWDAWLRGDLQGLLALLDPEVIWDTTHFHDWPESAYYGPEGVERFLSEWLDVWDDYEVAVDEILAVPDGRVVTLLRQRGRGRESGLAMDMEHAQITTVRDGKVTRFDNYEDRSQALEAAGLSE
jgi:ketosteroid isomerase-like protein